ncbi:hypothetical protein Tco_0554860, partial [Tanacetum coccineum]
HSQYLQQASQSPQLLSVRIPVPHFLLLIVLHDFCAQQDLLESGLVKSSHQLFLLMALEHVVLVVQIALMVIKNGSQLIILEHLTQLFP